MISSQTYEKHIAKLEEQIKNLKAENQQLNEKMKYLLNISNEFFHSIEESFDLLHDKFDKFDNPDEDEE